MDGLAISDRTAIGTYDLSVLFIDVRGYSQFAEQCTPEEVFTAVSCYARNVSEIVEAHGGRVLEVSGDGLLAVFGYPSDLVEKESAALGAALHIVQSRQLTMGLSVGVGIATGAVYVGAISAAGRAFWGATGDTTNLAARLQCLARELDAAVVIDSTTFKRAQSQALNFEAHPETRIRGRARLEDVFALSKSAA